MLENYFKILDKYRSKVTDYVDINITEEKQKELGDVIPVFGEDIFGCYIASAEELYLGAIEDEVLEKYEELLNLELDWL